LYAATASVAAIDRRLLTGINMPTGRPFLLITKDSPAASARTMRPLSLRSWRWEICSLTPPGYDCAE
jgi:hypothetical protein